MGGTSALFVELFGNFVFFAVGLSVIEHLHKGTTCGTGSLWVEHLWKPLDAVPKSLFSLEGILMIVRCQKVETSSKIHYRRTYACRLRKVISQKRLAIYSYKY
jgi:hypothetical protein